ncbi:putative mitochondrial protein AtMg00530 [Tasmannia lanceolata]|uniref:putative mitochondrial protein AtMg00530 n=1 Tax=Tasmannia lanceolata TaxID=3420 RepID=UPI0040629ED1
MSGYSRGIIDWRTGPASQDRKSQLLWTKKCDHHHGPLLVSFVCVRSVVCVFFLRLIRGLLFWGIKFLFFLLLLISHREQLLLAQGHQMRDLPPTPRNRSSGRLPSTHLSLYKKPLPRGEQKLKDEYVLDSRIHSRPDPPWNFRNLQKHSRRGRVMIFSKITRC